MERLVSINMVSNLTSLTNSTIVLSELMMLAYLFYWWRLNHSHMTGDILISWVMISVGYLVRIGYWALVVSIAGHGESYKKCNVDMSHCVDKIETYPQWAIDNRGWLFISALLISWGSILFIGHIEGYSVERKLMVFAVIMFLSAIPLMVNT